MTTEAPTGLQIDIVISNHNYGDYVTEAIESACAQTHPAVRVIVVDDGSTDDSLERLEPYADRIELVRKEQGGQASALNVGAARCRGDIIMFLDADDLLEPDAAAHVAAVFAADDGIVKVQFRMAVIDGEGRLTGAVKPPAHLPLPTGDVWRAELAFPFDLVWLPTSANAFRASALRRILPIPEDDYRLCADWYLNHMTALLGPVASLAHIGARYRVHGRNGYEPQDQTLDLGHIRDNIGFAAATARALTAAADELGYNPPSRILSIADLSGRLISLRLAPDQHPLSHDRVGRLVADAIRATRRREDVAWPMKLLSISWFVATAVAPRPGVRRLAELFLFPERRRGLNRVLAKMHRTPPPTP